MGNISSAYPILIGVTVVWFIFGLILLKSLLSYYVKVPQGSALIIKKPKGIVDVSFTGGLVLPRIHKGEMIDISAKEIAIVREGERPLLFAGQRPVELRASVTIRINPTADDIRKVAQLLGVERASKLEALRELFAPPIEQALEQAAAVLDAEAVQKDRSLLSDPVAKLLGKELDGFTVEAVAIHNFNPQGV